MSIEPPRRLPRAVIAIVLLSISYGYTFTSVNTLTNNGPTPTFQVKNGASTDGGVTFRHPLCRKLHSLGGSASKVWAHPEFAISLREASATKNDVYVNITSYVRDYLLQYYLRPGVMTRSIAHGISLAEAKRLLDVISSPDETLRIHTYGGSVTSGNGCLGHPRFEGSKGQKNTWELERHCAWPHRFGVMFDHILKDMLGVNEVNVDSTFNETETDADDIGEISNDIGEIASETSETSTSRQLEDSIEFTKDKFIEITNGAVPGTCSDTGSFALKYELFKDKAIKSNPPHMVWLDYSPNDSAAPKDRLEEFRDHHMPTMIRAARDMRPCDKELPVIGLFHGFFPDHESSLLTVPKMYVHAGTTYSVAAWHKTMMADFPAVVQHATLVHHDEHNPLMGTKLGVHMGIGSHVGMALTALYNMLHALSEACEVDVDDVDAGNDDVNATNATSHKQQGDLVPMVEPDNPQYFSPIVNETILKDVRENYLENIKVQAERCRVASATNSTPPPACAYAWMVNRVAGITQPGHIMQRMGKLLTHNDGWKAMGQVFRNPRTGFYAQKTGATFTLTIPDLSVDVHVLAVMYMKSYGPDFVDSVLNVDLDVLAGGNVNSTRSKNSFNMTGYHEQKVSLQNPQSFRLDGDGAKAGDTIVLKGTLKSGNTFKIAGLALCTF